MWPLLDPMLWAYQRTLCPAIVEVPSGPAKQIMPAQRGGHIESGIPSNTTCTSPEKSSSRQTYPSCQWRPGERAVLYSFCGPIRPSIGEGSQVGHHTVMPTLSAQACQSADHCLGQVSSAVEPEGEPVPAAELPLLQPARTVVGSARTARRPMVMRICKRIRPIVRPNSCPDCVGMVNTTVATGGTPPSRASTGQHDGRSRMRVVGSRAVLAAAALALSFAAACGGSSGSSS